jgi:hypothetical protein
MATDSWMHSWGGDGRREGTTPRPSEINKKLYDRSMDGTGDYQRKDGVER